MTRRAGGYTLVEMVGVMALAAVATMMLYRFWPQMDASAQQTRFFSDLEALQREVRELYDGQMDFTGLTAAEVAARGTVPARLIDRNSGALRTPWGDPILLAPATLAGDAGAPAASAASIRFSVASQSDSEKRRLCRALMPRLVTLFDTIDIGGSSLGQQVAAQAVDLVPANQRAQMDALCETQVVADPWMGGTFQ